MISKLAIQEIPGTDCRFLRFADNSSYNPDIPVENGILEITPPGKDCPVSFYVNANFNTVFNSSILQISTAVNHQSLTPLPEGVYKIKYSIKPNNILYEEFTYLRCCQLLLRYYQAVCSLFTNRQDHSKKDFHDKRKQLSWIKDLIDAAKYHVEECGKEDKGLELYDEAGDLLSKFEKSCCN